MDDPGRYIQINNGRILPGIYGKMDTPQEIGITFGDIYKVITPTWESIVK